MKNKPLKIVILNATSEVFTCIAAIGPELWHLGPLVSNGIVRLPATQFIRMAVGPTHHVKLTLIG